MIICMASSSLLTTDHNSCKKLHRCLVTSAMLLAVRTPDLRISPQRRGEQGAHARGGARHVRSLSPGASGLPFLPDPDRAAAGNQAFLDARDIAAHAPRRQGHGEVVA